MALVVETFDELIWRMLCNFSNSLSHCFSCIYNEKFRISCIKIEIPNQSYSISVKIQHIFFQKRYNFRTNDLLHVWSSIYAFTISRDISYLTLFFKKRFTSEYLWDSIYRIIKIKNTFVCIRVQRNIISIWELTLLKIHKHKINLNGGLNYLTYST